MCYNCMQLKIYNLNISTVMLMKQHQKHDIIKNVTITSVFLIIIVIKTVYD